VDSVFLTEKGSCAVSKDIAFPLDSARDRMDMLQNVFAYVVTKCFPLTHVSTFPYLMQGVFNHMRSFSFLFLSLIFMLDLSLTLMCQSILIKNI